MNKIVNNEKENVLDIHKWIPTIKNGCFLGVDSFDIDIKNMLLSCQDCKEKESLNLNLGNFEHKTFFSGKVIWSWNCCT